MQDTSFAIHPGNKKQIEGTDYRDAGSVTAVQKGASHLQLECENGYVTILFYSSSVARVVMNPKQVPVLDDSFAVIQTPENIKVDLQEQEGSFTLTAGNLTAHVTTDPLRITFLDSSGRVLISEGDKGMGHSANGEIVCYKESDEADHYYGFGEKTGFLDKRGEKMTMWNTDVYAPHNPETDALYQSIPFFMTLRNGHAHGLFFDNPGKTHFNMRNGDGTYHFSCESGQMDYYVMAGPTMKEVLGQYTGLTGTMPLPPKWAIGYHQSRYSYETEEEVRELVSQFIEKEIPVDAVYLDIHYMDGYRVFTFDEDRFPDPKKLIADLKEQGIRVVPIVDPGVKEDPEYGAYQEGIRQDHFCKYIEGNVYYGDVWPGNSAFPDFTKDDVRDWWGEKHRFYTELGIEGIWNDMNEPAVFNETKTMDTKVIHENNGSPKTHREVHNIYGLKMGEATYEGMKKNLNGKRTFLLTRAGYAGVQRYGSVWTGDNRSFWEHLQLAIPMCMNLGMSGVPFTGPDVGGFAHDANGQLLARWTQFGTFTPYFRNHSAIGTLRQEPWSFGEDVEKNVKKYIDLRYIWMPQLYKLFRDASVTGVPVMRPLVLEYPEDPATFNLSDQFMIGENVIVAPITAPDTFHRAVYLPEGNWVNYWTEEVIEGGRHILTEADLETLPVFVKRGSVVAHGSPKRSTAVKETDYQLHFYAGEKGETSYTVYDDDGETFGYETGESFEMPVTFSYDQTRLSITSGSVNGTYTPDWEELTVFVHGADELKEISVNGNTAHFETLGSGIVKIRVQR
ncbi:glycoside hydrolase family 31 protein [Alteribacter natronophilus]|uniref:glycoside hydrolase family 31 protein n=1 Tax=Alteribacter natronophilus TaxID=2583810 RepID=UPI00110DA7FD|nr:glycoside hydrolase family 31 protein [Alteribacter natronophilus]TMW71505.1 glycoside hydrolase family 31 protein [Alteribacter natronophilus]